MNRELIIIFVCIIFVGFFYLLSDETSTAYPVEKAKHPASIQNEVNDTTKTSLPDFLVAQFYYMDGASRYWLVKLFYAGWIYIGLMLLFAGGLSKFAHLIPLALCLCMLQNYLVDNN